MPPRAPLNRTQIATLYAPQDPPSFFRTYQRCNAVGALPDVLIPPPWHSPHQLAEWYRAHYRSSLQKPPPRKPVALPEWLRNAVRRGGELPTVAPKASAPPQPAPEPRTEEPPGVPGGRVDALDFARTMLERIRNRYDLVKHLPDQAPAAERAYFEALEKVQRAEARAKETGDSLAEMTRIINAKIDAVHARLPRHLARELNALRLEILHAAGDAETFSGWCGDFFSAVGERLSRAPETLGEGS